MEKSLGLKILSLRGVPVYLKPSWFLLMVIMLLGLGYYLGANFPLTGIEPYIVSALLAILVAFGVFIHEGAHALVGLARGQRVIYISMTLWGGVTKLTPGTALTSLWVSLAGPIVNLVYAGTLWGLAELLGNGIVGLGFSLAATANFFISIFNLIPAYPLDGGHALEALVTYFTKLRSTGMKVTAWATLMVIPLFIAYFLFRGFTFNLANIAILVMVCSFLWSAGYPALTSVGMQSSSTDRLRVSRIMDSVIFADPQEFIIDVVQCWDGESPILMGTAQNSPGWVPKESLRSALEKGILQQPISTLAIPFPNISMPYKGKRVDTMEYFNGAIYVDLEKKFTQGSFTLAYRVVQNHQTVGILNHRKIADTLFSESAYLRRT